MADAIILLGAGPLATYYGWMAPQWGKDPAEAATALGLVVEMAGAAAGSGLATPAGAISLTLGGGKSALSGIGTAAVISVSEAARALWE